MRMNPERSSHQHDQGGNSMVTWLIAILLASPLFGHPSALRIVDADQPSTKKFVDELIRIYAGDRAFRSASVIEVDTGVLNSISSVRRLINPTVGGIHMNKTNGYQKGFNIGDSEWRGPINSSNNGFTLMRIGGRFHGEYFDDANRYIISPYRMGEEWKTVLIVHDKIEPLCDVRLIFENSGGSED